MYCSNCGGELNQGATFCPRCGAVQNEKNPVVPRSKSKGKWQKIEMGGNWVPQPAGPGVQAPAKKKKQIILIACAAALLLAAVLAFLLLNGRFSGRNAVELNPIGAKYSEDGSAYIILPEDGSCIVIDGEIMFAGITADRKHVVVMQEDGTLYVTNKKLSKKTVIADNAERIYGFRNDGFIYMNKNMGEFRVLFSDNIPLKLDTNTDFLFATNTLSLAYVTQEGEIYMLPADSNEGVRISSNAQDVELLGISDDGQTVFWSALVNDTPTLYMAENGIKEKLGELDSSSYTVYSYAQFSKDSELATLASWYSDSMWIKKAGEAAVKVKLGSDCAQPYYICTESGPIDRTKASKISSLYVSASADEGMNLFYISSDGSRERILSGVNDYVIANGTIFYTDVDQNLYCGKLNKASISEEKRIASEVYCFSAAQNGKYIYYMKDCADGFGDLFCFKTGSDSAQKIGSDVAYYETGYGYGWTCLHFSPDGGTVLYYIDTEIIPGTGSYNSSLMMWSYGDKAGVKIADDVIANSVSSARSTGDFDPKGFVFSKYSRTDSNNNLFVDWIYYDGKTMTRLAADVA